MYIAELFSRVRFIHSECFDFRDSHSLIPRLYDYHYVHSLL